MFASEKLLPNNTQMGQLLIANDGGMILNKNIQKWNSSPQEQFLRLKDTGLAVWRGYMVGVSQQVNGKLISAGPDNGIWRKRIVNSQLKWVKETWGDGEQSKYNQHDDRYYTRIHAGTASPNQVYNLVSPNNCATGSSNFPNGDKWCFCKDTI